MLFNSFEYFFFFIIVTILYYIIANKYRYITLLVASCIFYMYWRIEFIFLILFSAFVNFFIAKKIYNSESKSKNFLILSLIVNFGLLFIFKYLVFINDSIISLYSYFGWESPISHFDIILPMGISFYTFQAVSYTIDVYKKRFKPVKNYFKFLLYIMFFPQLVAGPIERADSLLPQLLSKKQFKIENIITGSKFILLGLFRKIVIADRIAILVNSVYNSPEYFEGLSFIIATVLFAFQIYCDFCGYSEIAIGSAKILGIDLTKNFQSPYFANSVKDFWRRWHISLSIWFRDYLYIPLGGSRVSKARQYFNIFITFLISGIWHGANWTFVLWGMLHGIYQIIGDISFNIRERILKFLHLDKLFITHLMKYGITFALISFAWIFFRANSISDAFYIVANLSTGLENLTNLQYLYDTFNGFPLTIFEILISFVCIAIMFILDFFGRKGNIHTYLNQKPFPFRFIVYTALSIIILALAVQNGGNEFIYFQF